VRPRSRLTPSCARCPFTCEASVDCCFPCAGLAAAHNLSRPLLALFWRLHVRLFATSLVVLSLSRAGLRGSRIANSITIGASDDFQLGISPAVSAPPLPLLRSSSPLLPHVHSCNPHVDVLYLSCPPPATYSRHNTYHSGNIICEHCSLLCYAPPLPAPVLSFSSSLYPSLRSARSFRPFLTFAPPLVWGGGLASLASHLWSCRSGWVEWFARLHHHSRAGPCAQSPLRSPRALLFQTLP
jgi:hypothetical protein